MSDLGEVEYGDIEVALVDADGVPKLIDLLEQLGAPKGSKIHGAGEADRSFGVTEGLGIYLDGLNLPDDVYEQCDSNHVFEQLSESIDGLGEICSWWQGPTETALYMYGQSFEAMRDAIGDSWPATRCARTRASCRSPERRCWSRAHARLPFRQKQPSTGSALQRRAGPVPRTT